MSWREPIQFFRDLSISQKLYVYLMIFIIIPLVIAAIIINSKATNVITDKTHENVFQTLKQTRFSLENMIRETESLSISIFADTNIQDLINYYTDKAYLDFDRTKVDLLNNSGAISFQSIMDSRPYLNSISISKDDKIIFQYGDTIKQEDTRFQAAALSLKGKAFWTPVYELKNAYKSAGSKNIISLIRAVNNLESSKPIAIERISIDEMVLSSYYAGINSWNNSQIYIIDKEGTILSASDKRKLGNKLGEESYVLRVLSEQEGSFLSKVNKVNYAIFHYHLAETGWQVVQLIPERELNNQLYVINLFIFICIAVCLLFGIIFSIIQNRSIITPLKLLTKEMGKVKNGVFDVHLKITSQDEIGRVSFIFINMINQIKELIEKVYIGQIKERDAELKALQAQINPHFLYNTLDSIRWMAVKNKDYDVSDQIEVLADLFRHVLNKGEDITTIGEEIQHLQNYMFIQKNRFGDKIEFIADVDASLLMEKTLKLLLQPLVENAIFHGLERKVEKGTIRLTIAANQENLLLSVEDDGVGMDIEQINRMLNDQTESHKVFALKNIHDRIQLRYGKEYGLQIESQLDVGTKVQIILPFDKGESLP